MRIGFAAWHYMADKRYKNGRLFSSPDGSLLHAFSIIYGLQRKSHKVYRLYPDRDVEFVKKKGKAAFVSFSTDKRYNAYMNFYTCTHEIGRQEIELHWPDLDLVLLEWRMPSRYNLLPIGDPEFEPDLLLQERLIEHYTAKNTPIIALDLDYNMTQDDDELFTYVLEPGFKRGVDHHFNIPFVTEDLEQFKHYPPKNKIVYVGSRYDRDAEFDNFFGKGNDKITYEVYGNWLENNRDSAVRWPHVHFNERIHPDQLHDAYATSLATPLLLRPEYNKHGFMSIRCIETTLFGSIPLLPMEFKSLLKYPFWRIENEENMLFIAKLLSSPIARAIHRKEIIEFLKDTHDVSHFVKKIENFL